MKYLSKFTFLLLSTVLFFNACKKDDPILEDENELIHQVRIEFIDSTSENTYTWNTSSSDTILLKANQKYAVKVSFFTLSKEQKDIDITNEIRDENYAHQVFYTSTPSDLLSVTYEDKDNNNLPLGIETTFTTSSSVQDGKLRILLKHYSSAKDGKPTSGSTDVDVNFNVKIQ